MKKTINYSKIFKENSFSFRQEKNLTRLRRLYKHKVSLLNTKYNDILDNIKNFKLKIFIRIRPNNIFCTLKNLKTSKIILNKSSGLYEVQTSKNKLKYNIKIILQFFLSHLKQFFKKEKNILIEIIAGIRIRKKIFQFLNSFSLVASTHNKKNFQPTKEK
jgi:hypothetical protein